MHRNERTHIMAHQLNMVNGRASMAYVGATPWHRLGQPIDPNATIEEITEAAGFGFTIERAEAVYVDQQGVTRMVPNLSALHRSDNGYFISMRHETRFNIVQPNEIMEFYRDLIDTADGDFSFETAGVLYGGRKLWCLARAKDSYTVGKGDSILPYLLLTTANDGTMATTGKFTSVRVVCDNTLRMSLGANVEGEVRVPHSRKFEPDQVKSELGLIHAALKEFGSFADELAKIKITDKTAQDFFMRIYGPVPTASWDADIPAIDSDDYNTAGRNRINHLIEAYTDGPGASMKEADGTMWGALNAVTYYQDHKARTRATDGRSADETRLGSSQFGQGARYKSNAVSLARNFMG